MKDDALHFIMVLQRMFVPLHVIGWIWSGADPILWLPCSPDFIPLEFLPMGHSQRIGVSRFPHKVALQHINFCTVQSIAKLPKWSPKMMPTWLYSQHFDMFSLSRHYNSHTPGLALHTTVAGKCPNSPEDEQEKQAESRDSVCLGKKRQMRKQWKRYHEKLTVVNKELLRRSNLTDLHVQSVTMTGHIYRDVILEQHVRLFRGAMGAEFLFMDDNAPPHRANIIDECLQSEDITHIDWPAYSPDLNPIEHV
ncbi:transposable element Tcb2 transposase [Trichonephila clavipes]|nr:transposable element Tcb2 transposase [Trichonephila clavipes]